MSFTRAAAPRDGEDEFDVAGIDLLMTRDADCPGKPARAQGFAELRAHAIAGIGEDRSEPNAGRDQTIQFSERDLRLGSRRPIFGGDARALQPGGVADPGLRQEQPQAHHHRDLAARDCCVLCCLQLLLAARCPRIGR